MKKNTPEFILHLLFWIFSLWMLNQNFVFEAVEVQEFNGKKIEIFTKDQQLFYHLAISLLAKIVWAYGNALWALPLFLRQKQSAKYVSQLLILLASALTFEFLLIYGYASLFPEDELSINYFRSMWQLNLLFYLLYYGISVAYVLGKNWWKQERFKEELIREKLETELNFLKSQVNPHFLFNTLNNLFAIAERDQHQDLSNGISNLSQLMRYMLYDCKEDKVPLEKEIDFLRSMIDMQRLRIADEDDVIIALNVVGNYAQKQLAPLILIPFVENAFKHGINWKESSFIKIDFRIEEQMMTFQVVNSNFTNHAHAHDEIGGIGLQNVKRRLDLIYPNKYELKISEEEDVFRVLLTLELDDE